MANYDNDEIDDDTLDETEEEQAAEGEAAPAGNRNLLLAIGILGGIFLLLLLALLGIAFLRNRQPAGGANIAATNAVIQTANAGTASAATLAVAKLLTPSITPTATVTPTVTRTSVLAQGNTPVGGGEGQAGGGLTPTATGAAVGQVDTRTATVSALLTQRAVTSAAQTQAITTKTPAKTAVKGSATVKVGSGTPGMPQSGFADEMGLPGLVALSVGLIIVIVLVRRLRLSTSS